MHPMALPSRFFVTGTDTGVGKTLVSAILMTGLRAAYWKPVQSGLEELTDTDAVRRMTGFPDHLFIPETYRLTRPLSPHASAAHDGITISLSAFHLPALETAPRLIVEGAGGVMVPLNEDQFMVDLMKYLDLPVLLVARSGLGTINHSLLSLEKLRECGLNVFGVVLNGPKNPVNKQAIETHGKIGVAAEIEPLSVIDRLSLSEVYSQCFS